MSYAGALLLFFVAAAADGIVYEYGFLVWAVMLALCGAMALTGNIISQEKRKITQAVIIAVACLVTILYAYMHVIRAIVWSVMGTFMIVM